ncbi:hydroxymethylpyrimidine pyrophosphatase-like HAD family hydrolase [Promicromonospora sp. AC04]|uniref:HAD family hydrolase n=1 Tax=Promicromonospora sp. AC04 TaxID=2135723 RepID=UPI000D395F07|nr:HAD family hydrolase [Promicromonospora sp. AC04]PUB32578.1 hydroxymethylpyrimidine pyrophosphatase-like HAD family hydrolase [Promicromonospora sp. AC04]
MTWIASQPTLVVLDIDGTIAIPGTTKISQGVRDAVADVRAAGHHVVLASGRSLVGVLAVARELGITEGWVVASNGAVVARLALGAPAGYHLHQVLTFDPRLVVDTVRARFPGARFAVEVVGKGYRVTRLFPSGDLNGYQMLVDLQRLTERPTTRLIVSSPGVNELLDDLGSHEVTVNTDGDRWLDVTPPNLSKATALDNVLDRLGVLSEGTVAVGDGLNDLQMLGWAARGVAMAHAPAELRDVADEVTGTLQEDGAAMVLRSLLPATVPA